MILGFGAMYMLKDLSILSGTPDQIRLGSFLTGYPDFYSVIPHHMWVPAMETK